MISITLIFSAVTNINSWRVKSALSDLATLGRNYQNKCFIAGGETKLSEKTNTFFFSPSNSQQRRNIRTIYFTGWAWKQKQTVLSFLAPGRSDYGRTMSSTETPIDGISVSKIVKRSVG